MEAPSSNMYKHSSVPLGCCGGPGVAIPAGYGKLAFDREGLGMSPHSSEVY